MEELRTFDHVVLNVAFGLNRIAVGAAIQMPYSAGGIKLVTIVKGSIDLLQLVRRQVCLAAIIDEVYDERAIDVKSSCEPWRNAYPVVDRRAKDLCFRVEGSPRQ